MTKQFLVQVEMGAETRLLQSDEELAHGIGFRLGGIIAKCSTGPTPAVYVIPLVDEDMAKRVHATRGQGVLFFRR